MKRKLSVIVLVAMLAVVCLGTLVACKAGLSDDKLTLLLERVEAQAKKAEGKTSYTLDRVVEFKDSDDTMVKCAVDWTSSNDGVTFKKGDDTVEVTVGAGITVYNLIGTLVNSNGKAYNIEGNPVYIPISTSGSNQGNQGNQGGNNQGGNNQGGDTTKTVKEQFLSQVVTAPQVGTNYALAMYYGLPDAVYYAKATVNNYKLSSTTTAGEAAIATVETASNGYYIKLGGQYLNITSRQNNGKTYYNISLDSTATTVFTIDSNGVLLGAVDDDTYYIGTYQKGTETQLYTDIGANWSGFLTQSGNVLDGNQFPVRLIPSNATISGGNQGGTTTGGTTTPTPNPDGSTTYNFVLADYASAQSIATGTPVTTIGLDFATLTASGTPTGGNTTGVANSGKYYTTDNAWRFYQNENPALVITAKSGYTLVSVKFTYGVKNTGVLTLNGSNVASGTTTTVTGNTITFSVGNTGSATNGQIQITSIEFVYVAA